MKNFLKTAFYPLGFCAGIIIMLADGCVTSQKTTITPATSTDPATTNTVTVVNQANLDLDCAVLQLVGTPSLIYALEKEPAARPVVVDIQIALTGALVGADTNVVATINGLIGGDAALQASILPLIQGASALEQSLLTKYGTVAAVQITTAILKTDLNIVNAALAAVPAKTTP